MNILYGVCGGGMGHAMRSGVVAEHLESKGHHIRFVSYGGAAKYLEKRWPDRVHHVVGMDHAMSANSLDVLKTFVVNGIKQFLAFPAAHIYTAMSLGPEPDVVISDFEPWSARYANVLGIPLVAVDNIHFMNRCDHPKDVISGVASDRTAAAMMYPVANQMVPDARRYLVTTFVLSPTREPRTTLHAPILRRGILAAATTRFAQTPSDHVTVYFNSLSDHSRIARELQKLPNTSFHYFGRSDLKPLSHPVVFNNVTFYPFAEETFIGDLSRSRAVVGGAGFTLMSEAIYLKKPMLASPFGGQFEQILNANYLERINFGERARVLDAPTIAKFLQAVPYYADKLSTYTHDGNRELLASVEEAIRS